jgi:hypothetical protein
MGLTAWRPPPVGQRGDCIGRGRTYLLQEMLCAGSIHIASRQPGLMKRHTEFYMTKIADAALSCPSNFMLATIAWRAMHKVRRMVGGSNIGRERYQVGVSKHLGPRRTNVIARLQFSLISAPRESCCAKMLLHGCSRLFRPSGCCLPTWCRHVPKPRTRVFPRPLELVCKAFSPSDHSEGQDSNPQIQGRESKSKRSLCCGFAR